MLYEGILPKFCGIGGVIPGSNRTKCKVLYTAARSVLHCSKEIRFRIRLYEFAGGF